MDHDDDMRQTPQRMIGWRESTASSSKHAREDDDDHGGKPGKAAKLERKVGNTLKSEDSSGPESNNGDDDASDVSSDERHYDESQEAWPDCAAYDLRYEHIKSRCESLSKDLQHSLADPKCKTPHVMGLRQAAARASEVAQAEPLVIGLLGNTGVGKSSLVNSLTDQPGLAKAVAAGRSCTFFATQYKLADPAQHKRFSATLEYFSLDEIVELLSTALEDWNRWRHEKDPEWTEATGNLYEQRAATCLKTFDLLFRQYHLFEVDAMEENLDSLVRDFAVQKGNVKQLAKFAHRQLPSHSKQGERYIDYYEAHTVDDLHDIIDPLITESARLGTINVWPLVKTVTVGVVGSRFLAGHTLTDLPGLSDKNQIRVQAAHRHIEKCDTIYIVGGLDRIITNSDVDGLLRRYGRTHRVAVVVTKADEGVQPALAAEMRARGHDLSDYDHYHMRSGALDKSISKLMRSKKAGREAVLLQQIAERQECNSAWKGILVRARNAEVVKELRLHQSDHLPPGVQLDVFPVSNLDYLHHKRGDCQDSRLLIEDTGIPDLRRHALTMAAPRKMDVLRDFVEHAFRFAFVGCKLWLRPNWIEGRQEVGPLILKPQEKLEEMIREYGEKLKIELTHVLIAPLKDQHQDLTSAAVGHLNDRIFNNRVWHLWTIRAFITNYGDHETRTMARQSWNTTFNDTFTEQIHELFPMFQEQQKLLLEASRQQMLATTNEIVVQLRKEPRATILDLDGYKESIEGHAQGCAITFRQAGERFEHALRPVKLRAVENRKHGYFHDSMASCYTQCKLDFGPGVKQRWRQTLENHLQTDSTVSPFGAVTSSIETRISTAIDEQVSDMRKGLVTLRTEIMDDFNAMAPANAVDPREYVLRKEVQRFVSEAESEYADLQIQLKQLDNDYKH